MKKFTFPKPRGKEEAAATKRSPSPELDNSGADSRKPRAAISLVPPRTSEKSETKQLPRVQLKFPGAPKPGPQPSSKKEVTKLPPVEQPSEEAKAAQILQAWCRRRLWCDSGRQRYFGNTESTERSSSQEHGAVAPEQDEPKGADEQTEHCTAASSETPNEASGDSQDDQTGWARHAVQKKSAGVQTNKAPPKHDKREQANQKYVAKPYLPPRSKNVKQIINASPLKTTVPRNLRLYDQQRTRMLKLGGLIDEKEKQQEPEILLEDSIVEEGDEGSADGAQNEQEVEEPSLGTFDAVAEEVEMEEPKRSSSPEFVNTKPDWSPSRSSITNAMGGDRSALIDDVLKQHATPQKFAVLKKAKIWQPHVNPDSPPELVLEGIFEILAETGLMPDVLSKEEGREIFQPSPDLDETVDSEEQDVAERPKRVSFATLERERPHAKPVRRSMPERRIRWGILGNPESKVRAAEKAEYGAFVKIVRRIAESLDLHRLARFQRERSEELEAGDWLHLPSVVSWLVPGSTYRPAEVEGGEHEGRGPSPTRSKTPWSRAHPHAAARPRTSVRSLMMEQVELRLKHEKKLKTKQAAKQRYLSELSERRRQHADAWQTREDKKRRWREAMHQVEVLVTAIRHDTFSDHSKEKPKERASRRLAFLQDHQMQRLSFMDVLEEESEELQNKAILLTRPVKTNSRSLAQRLGFKSVQL